jgi:hypothetical protein
MLAFLAIELLNFIGGISMFNASASMFCILLFPFYSGEIYRPVKGCTVSIVTTQIKHMRWAFARTEIY